MPRKMLDAVQDAGPLHPREIRRDVLGHDRRIIAERSPGHETVRAECHVRDRREVDVEPVAGQPFGAGPRQRGDLRRGELTHRRGVGRRVVGDATDDAALLIERDERRQLGVRGMDRGHEGPHLLRRAEIAPDQDDARRFERAEPGVVLRAEHRSGDGEHEHPGRALARSHRRDERIHVALLRAGATRPGQQKTADRAASARRDRRDPQVASRHGVSSASCIDQRRSAAPPAWQGAAELARAHARMPAVVADEDGHRQRGKDDQIEKGDLVADIDDEDSGHQARRGEAKVPRGRPQTVDSRPRARGQHLGDEGRVDRPGHRDARLPHDVGHGRERQARGEDQGEVEGDDRQPDDRHAVERSQASRDERRRQSDEPRR